MCIPGYVYTWLCVYLAMCIPGYVYTWLCVYLAMCIPGYVYTWLCVYLAMCIPGYVYTWITQDTESNFSQDGHLSVHRLQVNVYCKE